MSYIAQKHLFGVRPFEPKDASTVALWMSGSPEELFMVSSSLAFPVKPEVLI